MINRISVGELSLRVPSCWICEKPEYRFGLRNEDGCPLEPDPGNAGEGIQILPVFYFTPSDNRGWFRHFAIVKMKGDPHGICGRVFFCAGSVTIIGIAMPAAGSRLTEPGLTGGAT